MGIGQVSSAVRGSLAVAAAIILMCLGCGSADYGVPVKVGGVVRLDGEPLNEVTVVFHCTGNLPADVRTQRTTTNDQGAFTIPKVYPGEYTVTFEKVMAAPEDPGMAPADLAASDDPLAQYTGEDAPTASVSETNAAFNFDLKSKS
jgi:hypothetical protein